MDVEIYCVMCKVITEVSNVIEISFRRQRATVISVIEIVVNHLLNSL
jgi:hypothetical protein